jgi:hypothetical protein
MEPVQFLKQIRSPAWRQVRFNPWFEKQERCAVRARNAGAMIPAALPPGKPQRDVPAPGVLAVKTEILWAITKRTQDYKCATDGFGVK